MAKMVRGLAIAAALLSTLLIATKMCQGESVRTYVSALAWQIVCAVGYGRDFD